MKEYPARFAMLGATLLAVSSTSVRAQAGDASKGKEAPTMQTIQVVGAAYNARRDDTASKVVVNHEELVKYGDASVAEALKRVPGVTVVSTGRGSDIRMRGLGGGYTQILLNGERAPSGFSLDSLPPEQVERIEVLRSASAEFSTESIAGTINIVLKKSVKKAQRSYSLSASVDPSDKTARTSLQLSDRDRQFSYSISGTVRRTHNVVQAPTTDEGTDMAGNPNLHTRTDSRETRDFDFVNLVPRLSWTLDRGDTVSIESFVNLSRFKFRVAAATGTELGTPPASPLLNLHHDVSNSLAKSDLVWTHTLDNDARLEMKFGLQRAAIDADTHRQGKPNATAPLTLDSFIAVDTRDHGLSSSGKYALALSPTQAFTAGWEASALARAVRGAQRNPNSNESFDGDVNRLALFGQDEWKATPQWSIYAGVRWEGIHTAIAGSGFQATPIRAQVLSPIGQTLYRFASSPGDQLRFALTRTFKAPDMSDLIPRRLIFWNNSATLPDTQGNPALRPELAVGADASYEHFWDKTAMFSIGVSTRRIEDHISRFTQLDSNGSWVSMPRNDGKARTRSLELETKFPLRSLLAGAPAIDVRLSHHRNWSEVDAVAGPNNRLSDQTPKSATLALDYAIDDWTMGGSYVFTGGGWSQQTAVQSSYSPTRRIVDLYAAWKIDPRVQLRLFVGNVLHQQSVSINVYRDANGEVRRTGFNDSFANARALLEVKF